MYLNEEVVDVLKQVLLFDGKKCGGKGYVGTYGWWVVP